MKVGLKCVIKSSFKDFQCLQQQQIVFRSGNNLCIKQIGKPNCIFVHLNKHISHLFCFIPTINKKNIVTAQKIRKNIIFTNYALGGEKKIIPISQQHTFFNQIQQISLLPDEFDSNIVYGYAHNKENSCVLILDFNKMKVLVFGYLNRFEDINVDPNDNHSLSICMFNGNHNVLKKLKFNLGQWQTTQIQLKSIYKPIIKHVVLHKGIVVCVTKTTLYVLNNSADLVQSLQFNKQGEIKDILKINGGAVIIMQNNKILLLGEEHDSNTYSLKGNLELSLAPNDSIQCIRLSLNGEQLWIRTTQHHLYRWLTQHLYHDTPYHVFKIVQFNSNQQQQGLISISTGKKLCLLTGNSIATLWSMQKNELILSTQLNQTKNKINKIIHSSAINPDGNSLMIGFQDKIKIFKILFTKIKYQAQFNIKRCQQIVYSHGGQYVACKYGKGINTCVSILNLLRLTQVVVYKIQAQALQIIWGQHDDTLIISTDINTIQTYKISQNLRQFNIKFDQPIVMVRIDYKTRKTIVSTSNYIHIVQEGAIIQAFKPNIQDYHYVFPLYGAYFMASQSGTLYWSYSLKFQNYHDIPLFSDKKFNLICRNSLLLAYSSYQDVVVLQCQRNQKQLKRQSTDNIVLIQRDQILSFFQKVKFLQSSFQILTAASQIKMQQQRSNFQNALKSVRQNFSNQISFLQNKFSDITISKLKQERQTQKLFQSLQGGQNKTVNDLQKMYDRKFQLEKQKYLQLEQTMLQQKMRYQKTIAKLQMKYHMDINAVRNQYSNKLKQQNQSLQLMKQSQLQNIKKAQTKIIDLQQQGQIMITNLQYVKDEQIKKLLLKSTLLQQELQKTMVELLSYKKDIEKGQQKQKQIKKQLIKTTQHFQQNRNRVKLLQGEIRKKDSMISQRDQLITEQKQQISDLEKAKYVLSFRTTQIRKQLQPKQALTDKLNGQLIKLQEQFKAEKKKNYQLYQKIQKFQKINEITKRQCSDLKISLKFKQKQFDQICSAIFDMVNTRDNKQWNGQIVKIYQSFIKQQKYKNTNSTKKDQTSQQINRHLVHVQQSLAQVTSGNERILKGKQKEIVRKMKENSDLIYQLNVMRKKQNQYLKQKNQLQLQNARLKRQVSESARATTRAHTSNTVYTKKLFNSRNNLSKQHHTLQIQQFKDSLRNKRQKIKDKSRLSSARRTLFIQDQKKQKGNKIFDLAKQLQTARNTIYRQDRMIQQLNQRLLGFPQT